MGKIVLDHVEGLEIDLDALKVANLHALGYLPEGLHLLANSVREQEIRIRREMGEHLSLWSSPPMVGLVTNCFGWFSISLISLLRLVRLLPLMEEHKWDTQDLRDPANQKLVRQLCRDYILRVAPAVYTWRNKIAAHPALTDPFTTDSIGTLEMSIMIPVAFKAPYYYAGAFLWSGGGEQAELAEWALTPTFEALAKRFWPRAILQPIPGLGASDT